MKTILCYGDSNTWGYIPGSAERYAADIRWPGVMRKQLGENFTVIEEGLNGRTTVWEDPYRPGRNGFKLLVPILDTHRPVDLVIVMLGTNDLKHSRNNQVLDSARGVGLIVETILKTDAGPAAKPPKVLLVAPAVIVELADMSQSLFYGAAEKSWKFAPEFAAVANTLGCEFLDSASIVESSLVDGVHLTAGEHLKLGNAIALKIEQIFKS